MVYKIMNIPFFNNQGFVLYQIVISANVLIFLAFPTKYYYFCRIFKEGICPGTQVKTVTPLKRRHSFCHRLLRFVSPWLPLGDKITFHRFLNVRKAIVLQKGE
jgi:hypothetical protein